MILSQYSDKTVYVFLSLATLVLRLPFFFEPSIDWDESTYLLMGADWIQGHLPYTRYLELKPPLAFVPFALVAALPGKTVIWTRLLGVLLVALSACLLHRVALRLVTRSAALWGCVVLVVYAGVRPGSFSTMTEHVALPLLILHLCWLLGPRKRSTLIWAGMALGSACLVRPNLAYVCFGSALALVVLDRRSSLWSVPLLAIGTLIPVVAVVMLYVAAGQLDLLIRTTGALLAVSSEGGTVLEVAREVLREGVEGFAPLLWATFLVGSALLVLRARRDPDARAPLVALAIVLASILSSIMLSGNFYYHYPMQALPMLALGSGVALDRLAATRFRMIAFGILALPLSVSVVQYTQVADGLVRSGTLFHHDVYDVTRFLSERDVEGEYVFFAEFHIGYFLTGARNPSYFVHPSNLVRMSLVRLRYGPDGTPSDSIRELLETEPRFIIRRERIKYLARDPDAMALLDRAIASHYERAAVFGELIVYERVDGPASTDVPVGSALPPASVIAH